MKRFSFVALVLFTLLALTTQNAYAATAISMFMRNDDGKPTFIFTVNGYFSQSELRDGYVLVSNGDEYKLHCSQSDETTVVCSASSAVVGSDVMVYFGGSRFWASTPVERHPAPPAPVVTHIT